MGSIYLDEDSKANFTHRWYDNDHKDGTQGAIQTKTN